MSFVFCAAAHADNAKLDPMLRMTMVKPALAKASMGKAVTVKAEREMIDCLVKSSDTAATTAAINSAGGEVRAVFKTIMVAWLPSDSIGAISDRPDVVYIEAAKPMSEKMNYARIPTKVDMVQAGTGLDASYNGAGVLVGVVDNSLDYENTDFEGSDGKTRVCYLNQKTVTGGTIECTQEDIENGDCSASKGGFGYHGTHVTGIAASANATYTGVAPQSFIAFAFNAPDDADPDGSFSTTVLEGVSAIFTKATSLDMPCAVNLSLGTSLGAHDDTSLLEQGLDEAVAGQRGRIIVNAAGNEQVNKWDDDENANKLGGIHGEIAVSSGTANGWRILMRPPITSYAAGIVTVWLADTAQCRSSTIEVKAYPRASATDTGSTTIATDAIDFNADNTTTKKNAGGTVEVDIATYKTNAQNGRPNALIFMGPTSSTNWSQIVNSSDPTAGLYFDVIIRVPSGTCAGDMWLYPDNTFVNVFYKDWLPATITGAGAYTLINGDSDKTTTIPGTASGVITAGSYMARSTWTDLNGVSHPQDVYDLSSADSLGQTGSTTGEASLFSSLGPTGEITGARTKPDILAPGEPIISTLASANATSFPDGDLGDSTHVKLEGTSMAAPHVTGIVALMLEKNNCLTVTDVKTALQNTATPIAGCPPDTCGSGLVDALSAMQQISADRSCYSGTSCGGGGGSGGCGSSLVPVSTATGILSVLAFAIPLGIVIARRKKR